MSHGHATGARIASNATFLFLGRLATAGATLLASPVLYATLGTTRFGIWSLLVGMLAIAGLADLGFGSAQLREVARASAGRDPRRACGALALGRLFYLGLGAVLVAVTTLGWPLIAGVLHLGRAAPEAQAAGLCLAASFIVDGLASPWRAILEGTQRMLPVVVVVTVTTVLGIAVGVGLAAAGHGLVGVGGAALGASVVRAALLIAVARRHVAELRPSVRALQREEIRPLLGYGLRVQGSQTGALVNSETDRFVIGGFSSAAVVAPFDLGSKLANALHMVPFCIVYALFPAAAALGAGDARATLDRLYLRMTRYLALFACTVAAGLVASAAPLVRAWIGRPLPLAAATVVVLAPGLAVHVVSGAAAATTRAEGAPGRETRYVLATAVLNVALTVPLLMAIGSVGVPLATSVATVCGTAYFLWSFHRASGRPLAPVLAAIWKPFAAAALAAAAVLPAHGLLPDSSGRLGAAVAAGSRCALAILLTATILAALRFFNGEDAALLRRLGWWRRARLRPAPAASLGGGR